MDTYDDPPNPFSTDPSPAPSRDEQAIQGGGSSSGMLPPTQPAGSGSQAGGMAYPELDIYPSNANANANTTRGFGGERGKLFGEDEIEDEDEGVKGITAGYPQLNLYPAVDTPDQESGPWSNSQPPLSSSSNSQPQSQPQPQSQSQSPNKPAASPPPPTYRPSFPNAGAGIKSYVGPRVKEEACCAMDEELQVRGGGIEVSPRTSRSWDEMAWDGGILSVERNNAVCRWGGQAYSALISFHATLIADHLWPSQPPITSHFHYLYPLRANTDHRRCQDE
jgi:hypothetical protein